MIIDTNRTDRPKSQTDLFQEYLSSKMRLFGKDCKSLHVFNKMIEPIEAELVTLPHYYKQIPIDYPQYAYEEGLRRIINPQVGFYKELPLRFGKIQLQVQEIGAAKNLDSAFMFYLGEGGRVGDGKTAPKTYLSKDYVGVALHENGALSAVYSNIPEIFPEELAYEPPMFSAAVSWYPKDNKELGRFAYPSSRQEVKETMKFAWDAVKEFYSQKGVNLETGSGLEMMVDVVMLAVETQRRAGN